MNGVTFICCHLYLPQVIKRYTWKRNLFHIRKCLFKDTYYGLDLECDWKAYTVTTEREVVAYWEVRTLAGRSLGTCSLSYFLSYCRDKIFWQKQLRGGAAYFISQLQVPVHQCGEVKTVGAGSSELAHAHSLQMTRMNCMPTYSSAHFLFHTVQDPSPGENAFGLCLPTPMNTIETIPHRHTHTPTWVSPAFAESLPRWI